MKQLGGTIMRRRVIRLSAKYGLKMNAREKLCQRRMPEAEDWRFFSQFLEFAHPFISFGVGAVSSWRKYIRLIHKLFLFIASINLSWLPAWKSNQINLWLRNHLIKYFNSWSWLLIFFLSKVFMEIFWKKKTFQFSLERSEAFVREGKVSSLKGSQL